MTTRIKHLYLHVPFCKSICYYCDFCHRVYDEDIADKWLERLEKEIRENCTDQYETIYIGGGTPTSLNESQTDRLLSLIDPFAKEVIEYTIEVNPESLNEEKVKLFRKHGINRISMGVQSSDDEILKKLNRKHSFSDVREKIVLLRRYGFDNISVDLMYSLPGQDMKILEKTIDDVLSLNVEHISLYSLTIEENSVFGKTGVSNLDEEIEADMYEQIEKRLTEAGYLHYEISNYCKEGRESKHNMSYWNYEDFLGLSLGASSKIGNHRYTNSRNFQRYLEGFVDREEDLNLSKDEMEFENIMMSLRTIYGLNISDFNQRYDCDFKKKYEKGLANPAIQVKDDTVFCKDPEILNHVLLDFLEYI